VIHPWHAQPPQRARYPLTRRVRHTLGQFVGDRVGDVNLGATVFLDRVVFLLNP
jgi:hypothetical protein